MNKEPAVYILTSQKNGTLYIGVTSNLPQRTYQHKHNLISGFSSKYNVHQLVYYEIHADMEAALTREKQIKKWKREWKINLIIEKNPEWNDLYSEII